MFFNSWIAFIKENYLFLAVCAALNVYYFRWDTPGNVVNSLLTVLTGAALLSYLVFLPCFYLRRNNLARITGPGGQNDELFFAKFGSGIEDLNFFREQTKVVIFPIIYNIRNLAYVSTIIFMQSWPSLSIQVVSFSSLLVIIATGILKPWKDKGQMVMQYIDEIHILLVTYHLYLFTRYMIDTNMREVMG
jgi:hypothetical protein